MQHFCSFFTHVYISYLVVFNFSLFFLAFISRTILFTMTTPNNNNPDDIIPLTNQTYSRGASPSTSGPSSAHNANGIQQKKGEFATSGVQPSFALKLNINTIDHVSSHSMID